MTRQHVIKLLRKHKPKNADELLRIGVPLAHIASGAFRHAYQVYTLPLIVKFPYVNEDYELNSQDYRRSLQWSITHSLIEMRSLRRVLRSKKKFKHLQKYMPKIYHHNPKTGVILMHKYKTPNCGAFRKKVYEIQDEIRLTFGLAVPEGSDNSLMEKCDIHPDNCGVDENGKVVIIDLGLLEHRSEPSEVHELS